MHHLQSCLMFCVYSYSRNKINIGLRKTAAIIPLFSSVLFHNLPAYCCRKLRFVCEWNVFALFVRWRNRYRPARVSKARRSNGFCHRSATHCELVRICSFVADGTVWLPTDSCTLWHQYPFVEAEPALFPVASHKLSYENIKTMICGKIEGCTN